MKKTRYLIVGSGRVSKHFQFYFSQLHLTYKVWDRTMEIPLLHSLLQTSTHVLLLISDSAIQSFYEEFLSEKNPKGNSDKNPNPKVIHFSGALDIPNIFSAHPLMAFGPRIYPLEYYIHIPFILDQNEVPFKDILPGIPNQSFIIKTHQKPLYHCLCVLAGNFPHVLWSQMSQGLEEMGLPHNIAHSFLKTNLENFLQLGSKSLTGPLVRKDSLTIEKNLNSLSEKPLLKEIYFQFIKLSWPEYFNQRKIS